MDPQPRSAPNGHETEHPARRAAAAFASLFPAEGSHGPDRNPEAAGESAAGGALQSRLAGLRNLGLPSASALRGALLSWAPAGIAPALLAFASFPEQLTWTSHVTSRVSSLTSQLYDEVTAIDGYGEALEVALLDLRGLPKRILDVGTGTGFVARRLKEQYPDAEVVGVDLSSHMVATARRNAAVDGVDITFELGDAAALKHDDASFDLVVCQNAPPYCDEMMRVLRPRGKALVVYSFGGPWVEFAWKALAGRLERAGASHVRGRRAGFGFYGLARKRG
jgi:protein-L-isoaspartate O-methyltransferase